MTKEPTSRPPQPRHRPFKERILWRRRKFQPSPPPPQSPLPEPCKTIHEELDCLLSAFSLFRPIIPRRFDLFGVLYVNPDPDRRHEAPEVTIANLKQICEDYQEQHAANGAAPENKRVVDELLDDMERNVEAAPVAFQVSQGSATDHSVRVALDASLLGVVTAKGHHERTITASRDVSVTASNCEMYHGYKLRKLLWQNPELFFTKILEIIDTDFHFQDGQRRMMAIVTKKIIADVSISSEASNQRDTGAGVGGPEGTVTLQGNHRVSKTAANSKQILDGIAGIHFLMFPIERLDEHMFRIRPGVTVDAPRREDCANNSSTRNAYEKWYQNGANKDMDANRTCDFTMPKNATLNSTLLPRPALVLTAEPQKEDDTPSSRSENILREQIDGGVTSAEDLVDGDTVLGRPHLNRIPYVNINLKPTLNEFAIRQVTLALKFLSEAEQDKSIDTILQSRHRCTALRLFRSALRKRCYGSTVYALESLGNFYGCSSKAASNEPAARAFKFCAVVLRNLRESYRVWVQILMEKARLRYENRPEAVIARMVATPSPCSQMQCFLCKVPIEAMFNLGHLLQESGEGVERDVVRAMELYESAIEKGDNVFAMVNLGYLLQEGAEGVERDAVRARELYESAIEKGDMKAMFNLGVLLQEGAERVERDAVRAMELYESAIEKGDIDAIVNLGVLLQEGAEGVEQDAVRARELYESAIEKGDNVFAMVNLGYLLQEGAEGVERDAVRAMELYESAIENADNVGAMKDLGYLV